MSQIEVMTDQEIIKQVCQINKTNDPGLWRRSQSFCMAPADNARIQRIMKRYGLNASQAVRFAVIKAAQELTESGGMKWRG